jgi:hypothetical protein
MNTQLDKLDFQLATKKTQAHSTSNVLTAKEQNKTKTVEQWRAV